MKKPVDTRLERDPRYAVAKARYAELNAELNALQGARDEAQTGLSSLVPGVRNLIDVEAAAMLTGTPAPDLAHLKRERMAASLDDLTHKLAVHRSAVDMQKRIVDQLRGEVSNAICRDSLPQHRANVAGVIEAALALCTALEQERELRDSLEDAGVLHSGSIRPMPIGGFGRLADDQSRISKFLLECHQFGFIDAADLPDVIRDRIPSKAKAQPAPVARRNDGWLQSA